MNVTEILLCLLFGYIFGCFLTAEIVAKANNVDLKNIDKTCPGKGNPGMANIMLNVGFKQGVLVFIGDSLKTIIPMLLASIIFKELEFASIYVGFGVLLGHNYPFWRRFNGGKGVLVTVMWFIFLLPKYCWICFAICALIVVVTGNLNIAAVALPFIGIPFAYTMYDMNIVVLVIISAIIMIIRNKNDLLNTIKGKYEKVTLSQFIKKK